MVDPSNAVVVRNLTDQPLTLAMFMHITSKDQLGDDGVVFCWQMVRDVGPTRDAVLPCSESDPFELVLTAIGENVPAPTTYPVPSGDDNAIYGRYVVRSARNSLVLDRSPSHDPYIIVENDSDYDLDLRINRSGLSSLDVAPVRGKGGWTTTVTMTTFSPGLYVVCVPHDAQNGGWFPLAHRISSIASVQPNEWLQVRRTADGLQIIDSAN